MKLKEAPGVSLISSSMDRLSQAVYSLAERDDRAIIMRQSVVWSRNILWTIIVAVLGTILWACFAKMDEVVHASGKLEPRATVLEVQAPIAGVITKILIQEGERVRAGQPLIGLNLTVAASRLDSLQEQLASIRQENEHYTTVLSDTVRSNSEALSAKLPLKIAGLAKDRAVLRNESLRLQAQIAADDAQPDLTKLPEEERILLKQAKQDRVEKIHALQLASDRAQADLDSANEQLVQKQRLLENTRKVFESYKKLVDSGGVAEIDYLAREAQVFQAEAEVQRLKSAVPALQLDKDKAQDAVVNFTTNFRRETMLALGDNRKVLAELDSRLFKALVENSRRISELESNISESSKALEHHEIQAPADGIIFELPFTKPGNVVAAKDTVVKIVPNDELIAKLAITNKDIGFVNIGQSCEIEVESFPAREYGYIKGNLTFVGSDALPPSNIRPYYAFPVKIDLHTQSFSVAGKTIPLQSGMAISGKIKTRERRVIYQVLDLLLGPLERKGTPETDLAKGGPR